MNVVKEMHMGKENLDFLILFESKTRELESICLLKCELERRGYKVKICYVHSLIQRFLRPRVVVVPYLYSDNEIKELLFCGNYFCKKVLNLQWEQVISDNNNRDGFYCPKNGSEEGAHISWGINNRDFLFNSGVKEKNIFVTGSINMDFCHQKYKDIYDSKQISAKKYGLDGDKKWLLFISSFTMTDDYVYSMTNSMIGEDAGRDEFRHIMIESQSKILEWFKKILESNKDVEIIYRPHPAELGSKAIRDFELANPRFKCIGKESVRYWIYSCDYISTWFSTSIVDCYYMNKSCMIYRPVEIPEYLEVDVMKGAFFINKFEKIELDKPKEFPINSSVIESFYGSNRDGMVYKRVADACETILEDECFGVTGQYTKPTKGRKYILYLLSVELCKYMKLSKFFPSKRKMFENVEKNILHSKKIIREKCKKFKKII